MTAKSRAGNPMTILGCGILAIMLFGGGVWWLSDKPINQLAPALEKLYSVRGFHCSLHLQEARIDVEPPAALELDRFARRRLGGLAWRRYLQLTKGRTQILAMHVGGPPEEVVLREQFERFDTADVLANEMVSQATAAAGAPVSVLVAPGTSGAAVVATTSAQDMGCRRAAEAILKIPNVAFVQVKRAGKVVWESGPDAKLYAGAIAPVGSR